MNVPGTIAKDRASERFVLPQHADSATIGEDQVRQIEDKNVAYRLGVDELICYVQWGFLEHEDIKRTIEVLGKEVIPELANYQPKLAASAGASA